MPEEKETQDQTVCTQHVFVPGDTVDHLTASPWIIITPQFRIVFDEENGNRDEHIGASLHQSFYRFLRIRFRKDDQRHDRMTKNFDPPLESHEGKIGPGDGNETVEKERDEPTILRNNF